MLFDRGKSRDADTTPHLEGGAPFRKRLAWWIKEGHAPMVLDVTPQMAAVMLEHNDRNRGLRTSVVKRYAADMKAGKWQLTMTPVIFSKDRLIDGQHRLEAVVQSGATVKLMLAFGAPDEAFYVIDRGATRTGGDIFSINGVQHANMMAAATSIVRHYDLGTIGTGVAQGNSWSLHELYEEYERHPNLQRSAAIGALFRRSRIAPPAMMAALHYICARNARGVADEFFTKLATGEDINRKDPVYVLRKRFLEQSVSDRLTRSAVAAMTIKAWNATRGNLPYKTARWTGTEAFPKAR